MTNTAYERKPQLRQGATLIELMVALTSVSLLAIGMTSSIYLATEANYVSPTTANTLDAANLSGDLAAELRYALSFTERTATAVTFTVADRDGDANPETIRYAWSGAPGASLTRQYNAGPAAVLVNDVHAFQCDYFYDTVTLETGVIPENESAEQLLSSYTPVSGFSEEDVEGGKWKGEYFSPGLANGVVRWSVTKVELSLVRRTSNQIFYVQLRPANAANQPTSTVLEQKAVNSSSIGTTFSWYTFMFNTVANLDYHDNLVIVLTAGGSDQPVRVRKRDEATAGSNLVVSSNQGASWTTEASKNLLYKVHGKVITFGAPETVEKSYLERIGIALQVSDDPDLKVKTQTHVLNRPEVTLP